MGGAALQKLFRSCSRLWVYTFGERTPHTCRDAPVGSYQEAAVESLQLEDAIELIRMEYAEMPDLQLTLWQAQRLLNLPTALCDDALAALTRSGFLVKTSDGIYASSREVP
jgi:hypothetical protein